MILLPFPWHLTCQIQFILLCWLFNDAVSILTLRCVINEYGTVGEVGAVKPDFSGYWSV
jgi:hypothetical protein